MSFEFAPDDIAYGRCRIFLRRRVFIFSGRRRLTAGCFMIKKQIFLAQII